MRHPLKDLLREPGTGEALEVVTFDADPSASGDVREGVLYAPRSGRAWPIINGVPSMLDAAFTDEFLERHAATIAEHPQLSALTLKGGRDDDWSFSAEWDDHFSHEVDRTWGWTVAERVAQFFMETASDAEWLKGKLVLDAGCGNGVLSEELSKYGATVVGLDFSSSVMAAEKHRKEAGVHFAQGDLMRSSLASESFDLIASIGVLHHTPETEAAFREVARLVKPGGRFYIWLYRVSDAPLRRYFRVPIYDTARRIVSRLPTGPREKIVHFWARVIQFAHRLRGNEVLPLSEYIVSAYDDLAPMWRYYHPPIEVSRWFYECGFGPVTLTHWDNPYGFGVIATRDAQSATPGMHYGEGSKLWDESKTIIG